MKLYVLAHDTFRASIYSCKRIGHNLARFDFLRCLVCAAGLNWQNAVFSLLLGVTLICLCFASRRALAQRFLAQEKALDGKSKVLNHKSPRILCASRSIVIFACYDFERDFKPI